MDYRAKVLEIAASQIGVAEDPPHSNHVPYWEENGVTVPPGQGNPWCARFVSWVFRQAGFPLPPIQNQYGFVYVPDGTQWFLDHGQLRQTPEPGFIAFYRAHTGIVESVETDSFGAFAFTAIEGNEGDQVMRVVRRRNDPIGIAGFGDPLYPGDIVLDNDTYAQMQKLVLDEFLQVMRSDEFGAVLRKAVRAELDNPVGAVVKK